MPERSKPYWLSVFPAGAESVIWFVVLSRRNCGVVRIAMGQ